MDLFRRQMQFIAPSWPFSILFAANLFFSFHYTLAIYSNSSYLETFMPKQTVGLLFVFAACINILFFIYAGRIIRAFGSYRFILTCVFIDGLALLGLALGHTALIIIPAFILYDLVLVLINYTFDLYLESAQTDENSTGRTRSIFLTIMNFAFFVSPIFAGFIIGDEHFKRIYFLALLLWFPFMLIVIRNFHKLKQVIPEHTEFFSGLRYLLQKKDIRSITIVALILQIFYTWLIIYVPIYLHDTIGFSWPQIGIIITTTVSSYVLFQFPIGNYADKHWGEKGLLLIGLSIVTLSMAVTPFLTSPNIIAWIALLFVARAGASIVEVMAETFFFKKVTDRDSNIIGLFRMTRPLAYIIAPLVVSAALFFTTIRSTFFIIAVIIALGLYYGSGITNTRNTSRVTK